jgi:3',5'-cyclic-AMP phosphodiesterase
MIEYSPYDVDMETQNHNSLLATELTKAGKEVNDTFTFAFMSDTHLYYDELSSAVSIINNMEKVAFLVICGDITQSGLAREFQYYWKQVKKLNKPFITVIGNHDYLSNGADVYKRMFGPTSFSFTYGNHKFIAFDDVVWEKGNVSPDFGWLDNEVEKSDGYCIILAHIPPFGDQYTDEYTQKYENIVSKPAVVLSMHGHEHHMVDTIINSKRYFVSRALLRKSFYLVHITGSNLNIETVNF